MAAVYHIKLRRALLVVFRNQLRRDGTRKDSLDGVLKAGQQLEALPTLRLAGPDGIVLAVQVENEPVYRNDWSTCSTLS